MGEASTSSGSSGTSSSYNQSEFLQVQYAVHDHFTPRREDTGTKPIKLLLYGKAGDGKSTIGNMLLDGRVEGLFDRRDCQSAVPTSSMSKRCSENKQWEVIDTVGLFSPGNRTSDAHLIDKLHDFLLTECPEIDVICYVKKASKYTGADEICLNHFKRLFKGHKVEQNVVLVFTSCPDQNTFFKFNDHVISKHMGAEYKRRVGVEFPPPNSNVDIEEMMKEKRASSLKDLEKELKQVVSEVVGPVVLRPDGHFSCYNTLNIFQKGVDRPDVQDRRSIADNKPPLIA
ncbi:hypothetical protein MPTK1_8g02910 [Marchantia polymorpha subsp. ruderalis]|nr:hypothetical protein MARPO_0012s0084 [Marchantia polymorpha]BBN18489.1 hypothetical protein Mp_8g02910 [Marchantia polymorpha subsp. ruderalis]|eukprot:PTQ46133.1 hypothetical protein MARPO_0012s0084 [Marchantia polymorpha]